MRAAISRSLFPSLWLLSGRGLQAPLRPWQGGGGRPSTRSAVMRQRRLLSPWPTGCEVSGPAWLFGSSCWPGRPFRALRRCIASVGLGGAPQRYFKGPWALYLRLRQVGAIPSGRERQWRTVCKPTRAPHRPMAIGDWWDVSQHPRGQGGFLGGVARCAPDSCSSAEHPQRRILPQ